MRKLIYWSLCMCILIPMAFVWIALLGLAQLVAALARVVDVAGNKVDEFFSWLVFKAL